jgi:predicted  nucleic acid-binding Zn-ribbon protein
VITDADLKKLATVFATKEDIGGIKNQITKIDRKVGGLETKVDNLKDRIDTVEVNLTAEAAVLKDRIDTVEVNLTAEIATLHDENIITSEYRNLISDHEDRISKIEKSTALLTE